MLLVTVLGFCFGFCLLVVKLDYSIALGAFLIGAIMAESKNLACIEHLIAPVRDMFSAIFFVTIGLLLNPAVLVDYAWPIAVITIAVVFGKIVSYGLGTFLAGKDGRTSMRVDMSVAQIGEFFVHHRVARVVAEGDQRLSLSDRGRRVRADDAVHAVSDPRRRSDHPAPRARCPRRSRTPSALLVTRESDAREWRPDALFDEQARAADRGESRARRGDVSRRVVFRRRSHRHISRAGSTPTTRSGCFCGAQR